MNKKSQFNWRTLAVISLGISITLVALLAYQKFTKGKKVAPGPDSGPSQEEIRQTAWETIQPHLGEAEDNTQKLTNELIQRIKGFFKKRKQGTTAFAEAALGWRSKWELIKSKEGHRKFITEKFSQYIFSPHELNMFLQNSNAEYAEGIRENQNRLLVNIRADLDDLPIEALPNFSSNQVLSEEFNEILNNVIADIARKSKFDIGKSVGTLVVSEIVTMMVIRSITSTGTRLGVSATIIGGGAASSTVTFGAGLVVAIVVDTTLNWIINWAFDPAGNISTKLSKDIDKVADMIISGDPMAWQFYGKTEALTHHKDPRIQKKAAKTKTNIERNGALGLKYALGRLAGIQSEARKRTLHQLVFGVSQ